MINTLHVILDNKVVEIPLEKIFDTQKFDTFLGSTFSVTPSFMNRYLEGFTNIKLVVGIPEERVKYGANLAAKQIKAKIDDNLNNEPVELYQSLTTNIKQKIAEKNVELFIPLAYVIHSKFYLMSNQKTGDTRVVIGSTNLSEQALNKRSNQFEMLFILDNHPLYSLYLDYYKNILKPILINYLPKELLDINTKRLKKYNKDEEQNIEEIIYLNNQEISTIKESSILETLNQTNEKIKLGI